MLQIDLTQTIEEPLTLHVAAKDADAIDLAKALSWSVAGYQEARARRWPVAPYLDLLADQLGLGVGLAEAVCCGQVPVQSLADGSVLLQLRWWDTVRYRQMRSVKGTQQSAFDVVELPSYVGPQAAPFVAA